ncbi:NfeD family protein [Martelella endophytica]|uniref:Membrane protein n=1 Tax=Martelella endophytica TaxID=1486262 RepID=A0A0D5LK47_MAREN|nr:NfeD family protein [Martelella endophytica]AJY44564.1 membrane protein [Martelella endophytica]
MDLVGIISSTGPWGWIIAGLLLLVAELIVPGVFLMWIGIAALVLGILSLVLWPFGFWGWQLQLLLFAVFTAASIIIGRRVLSNHDTASDQPFLNQRAAGLVGRTAVLIEPIDGGRGRIKLDDTIWVVEGPDLAAGTHVRIVSGDGRNLTVAPVE